MVKLLGEVLGEHILIKLSKFKARSRVPKTGEYERGI
jgi:hypothetical protein